jgi:hypothetical protein
MFEFVKSIWLFSDEDMARFVVLDRAFYSDMSVFESW